MCTPAWVSTVKHMVKTHTIVSMYCRSGMGVGKENPPRRCPRVRHSLFRLRFGCVFITSSVFGSWTDAAVLNLLVVVTIFFDFLAGLRASGDGADLAEVVWAV